MKADRDNLQRPAWWCVSGIRHTALVRAFSKQEAVEKAHKAGAVDESWESSEAHFRCFLGELPDVVEL